MRGGPKTLAVALVALLIAAGLAACGGGDSSSSATAGSEQGQTESTLSEQVPKQSGAKSDERKPGSDSGQSTNSGPSAGEFTPQHHSDSGGGSAPLRTKGGDNSIQEFGEEADTSEFDAAAEAVHNFLDARAEGNWAAACEYMSKGVVESFEKLASQSNKGQSTSCARTLEALINPAAKGAMKAEAEQADVHSLRSEGEQAFVIYTAGSHTIYAMPMAKEDGDWKVASLAGTPLN